MPIDSGNNVYSIRGSSGTKHASVMLTRGNVEIGMPISEFMADAYTLNAWFKAFVPQGTVDQFKKLLFPDEATIEESVVVVSEDEDSYTESYVLKGKARIINIYYQAYRDEKPCDVCGKDHESATNMIKREHVYICSEECEKKHFGDIIAGWGSH